MTLTLRKSKTRPAIKNITTVKIKHKLIEESMLDMEIQNINEESRTTNKNKKNSHVEEEKEDIDRSDDECLTPINDSKDIITQIGKEINIEIESNASDSRTNEDTTTQATENNENKNKPIIQQSNIIKIITQDTT